MHANSRVIAIGLSLAVSALLCEQADASYTGLSVTSVNTTVTLDPDAGRLNVPVTIHRVWANFTSADDGVVAWGGGGSLGPGIIRNWNSTFTAPGSGFQNHLFGGVLPPNASTAVSNSDSYFTIGVTKMNQIPAGQGFGLSVIPGTPGDVTGTTIDLAANGGGGVFATAGTGGATNPTTLAGFTGDGDVALRVLLMQLTVRRNELVSGAIGISVRINGASTTLTNQMFGVLVIPGPGALAAAAAMTTLLGPRRARTNRR